MFITEDSPREDLLTAIAAEPALRDALVAACIDPEMVDVKVLRDFIVYWIIDGDECGHC